MQIVVVGLSQHTASVAVREKVALRPEQLPPALDALRERVGEGFILSTCNRLEAYALVGHGETGAATLRRFLAELLGVELALLTSPHAFARTHADAVRHLFRVAGGLESMVLGEDQILGQLRNAVEQARALGALGPVMDRLGSAALTCGKRIRAETGLTRHSLSVVSVAMQAAQAQGPIAGKRVVVLGAGQMAELVLKHLAGAGAERVTVLNRSFDRGRALAARYGAEALPLAELVPALAEADVAFGCTSAGAPVLTPAVVRAARERGDGRALVCVDLGVPRDVDPEVSLVEGVTVRDMDRLQALADANRAERLLEVGPAERIVGEEVERFLEWRRARDVVPTITLLRARADAIREAEVERALARLPELSPQAQEVVRSTAMRIVNKLLHEPTVALKRDPEGGNMALVLQHLFALATPPETCPVGRQREAETEPRGEPREEPALELVST